MSTLKRISAAFVLTFVVAISASAGITESPPCADPGQTSTPPCAVPQTSDDPEIPGQTNTPPAADAGSELSFTDLAVDVVSRMLFLF